jgi:hypothetical protein
MQKPTYGLSKAENKLKTHVELWTVKKNVGDEDGGGTVSGKVEARKNRIGRGKERSPIHVHTEVSETMEGGERMPFLRHFGVLGHTFIGGMKEWCERLLNGEVVDYLRKRKKRKREEKFFGTTNGKKDWRRSR